MTVMVTVMEPTNNSLEDQVHVVGWVPMSNNTLLFGHFSCLSVDDLEDER